MSNPFDQFASEMQAALPPGAAPPAPADDPNPFSFGPPPPKPDPASNKPVMNAPPMANGYGGYGQQPLMGQQPMYGGMDPGMQQYGMAPQMSQGYGAPPMKGMGGPPSMGMGMPMGAPPTQNPVPAPAGPPPGADPFSGYGVPTPAPSLNLSQSLTSYDLGGSQSNIFGAPPTPNPQKQINPYGAPSPSQLSSMPYGAPPTPQGSIGAPPLADPFSSYGASDQYGGPPSVPQMPGDPYGAPPTAPPAPPASDPFGGYGLSQPGSNPYVAPPVAALPPSSDPYGSGASFMSLPSSAPPSDPYSSGYGSSSDLYAAPQSSYGEQNPYGGAPPFDPNQGALVLSQQQSHPYALAPHQATDPFSVFNESSKAPAPPPPPQPQYQAQPQYQGALVPAQAPPPQQQQSPLDGGDLWGDLGFDSPPTAVVPASDDQQRSATQDEKKDDSELPPGGEFYDARIFTPTLGVMFFKPQELTDSLFLNTDRSIVDGLNERPVVAFIVEGSSARSAGVELGHVLLKVNGVDVKNPKEASRLIKEGPRPLPLLFYVPNTEVVVAEGEHMVKYDTRETTAPNSAKDWKPKYVVIGGIIAQPWMMNMYRSKSEYDIAVIETQARRPVSVKVKQFSLQGARIQNDWQGPQMVKYKNKLHPWKYIVVLPVARNPIKISSPNLSQLKPVHEGIRRVLLAQQRDRGNPHSAAPVRNRDPYARPQNQGDPYGGRGNGYAPQQQQYSQQAYGGY